MLDMQDVDIVIPSNMLFCFEEKKELTDRCMSGILRSYQILEKKEGVSQNFHL